MQAPLPCCNNKRKSLFGLDVEQKVRTIYSANSAPDRVYCTASRHGHWPTRTVRYGYHIHCIWRSTARHGMCTVMIAAASRWVLPAKYHKKLLHLREWSNPGYNR